jgi:hypothetical protein
MTPGPIHISIVKMSPRSTRRTPYVFNTMTDARAFSSIAMLDLWAELRTAPDGLYHIWPGGRALYYSPEIRKKWAPRRSKNLGTGSGTACEGDF